MASVMFEVNLPIQLRHRELHGKSPLLFAILGYLQKLVKENYKGAHTGSISDILLWVATNHPEVYQGEAELLSGILINTLCFRDSYEKLDKLIPTEALTTLLNSKACRWLEDFCGYVDPEVLMVAKSYSVDNLAYLKTIKLALGKHNIDLFINKPSCFDHFYDYYRVYIHLLCRELDQEDLTSLPIIPFFDYYIIYISDVGDQDVAWVVKAVVALNRHNVKQLCEIKFKCSKLTSTGFEAIAKGLFEREEGLNGLSLGVSSPHMFKSGIELSKYEESEKKLYFNRISSKYNMQKCFSFTNMKYEQEFWW